MQALEKQTTVGLSEFCFAFIGSITSISLNCLYVIAYYYMPYELKELYLSKYFLTYIVCSWISSMIVMTKFKNIFEYWGETMSAKIWKKMQKHNKFLNAFLNFNYLICIALGSYFVSIFIPFSNGCDVYDTDDAHVACVCMRLISVLALIFWSLSALYLCIMILLILCLCCVACCCNNNNNNNNDNNDNNNNNEISNVSFAVDYLKKYNPIPTPTKDTECSICQEEAKKNESNWTELQCKHKFHANCIAEWLKYRINCPNCRAIILMPSENV